MLALYMKIKTKTELNEFKVTFNCTMTKAHIHIQNSIQKQPSRGVPRKSCSENMQQIYRKTLFVKCDFNNVAKQHY